jgi:DNA invertase Pin-like site-specific DNA recombinase
MKMSVGERERKMKRERENESVRERKEQTHEKELSLPSCFKVTPSVSTKMYFSKKR